MKAIQVLDANTGRVWVVGTLRADLYQLFLAEPALLVLKTKGATYDLVPPGPNDVQPTSGKTPPNKNPLMRQRPWWLSFLLVLILNYLLVQLFLPERPQQRIDVPALVMVCHGQRFFLVSILYDSLEMG